MDNSNPAQFKSVSDETLHFQTGLNRVQFNVVLSFLTDSSDLPTARISMALFMYLARLHRGYTFDELAKQYRVSRQTASNYVDVCRKVLSGHFCDTFISFNIPRPSMITHVTNIAKQLHAPIGDHATVVFDGTYLFIEKSSNFSFQRMTYSGHKHRNLIKPMMAVYPDGYMAGVFGPFKGNTNDASIMQDLLEQVDLWTSFMDGDIMMVDRGFRDVIPSIEAKGYVAKMPLFADAPRKPLTTEQANKSRIVTKCRYVVEVVNGAIKKQFAYFDKTIRNTTVKTLFSDFRNACGIYNATFTSQQPDRNKEDRIIQRMLNAVDKENALAKLVQELNLNKRSSYFQKLDCTTTQFDSDNLPIMDLQELELYGCGTYQLKMAKGYYADHISDNGDFHFEVATEKSKITYRDFDIDLDYNNALLMKTKVRSRHSNSDKYFTYILFDKTKHDKGMEGICGHYCQCKVGNRVVGCCSHVMMVLWYFTFARHNEENISLPAIGLSDVFNRPISSDEDE